MRYSPAREAISGQPSAVSGTGCRLASGLSFCFEPQHVVWLQAQSLARADLPPAEHVVERAHIVQGDAAQVNGDRFTGDVG
jgi:hypothetical protein